MQGCCGEPAGPAAAARGPSQLRGDCLQAEPAQQQVVPPQGEVRAQEGDSSEEKLLATKSNKLPATNIIEYMQASSDMNC